MLKEKIPEEVSRLINDAMRLLDSMVTAGGRFASALTTVFISTVHDAYNLGRLAAQNTKIDEST